VARLRVNETGRGLVAILEATGSDKVPLVDFEVDITDDTLGDAVLADRGRGVVSFTADCVESVVVPREL
jgi:hypothetical protein